MKKTYPLSQAQYDMFMECMENMTLSETNLSWEVVFPKHTDPNRLVNTLRAVIAARPTLRTRFLLDSDGKPRQYIDEGMAIPVPQLRMNAEEMDDYIKHQLSRPYNLLGEEPLCRFAIVEAEDGFHLLHSAHHTIIDGFTICTLYLKHDLPAAYSGKPLRKEPTLLCEYAEEEEKLIGTEEYEENTRRYAAKFAGVEPTRLSPEVGSRIGRIIQCDMNMGDEGLAAWCRQHHLLPNALVQAAFSLVLSRWSGQRKVAYLSIRHGRIHRPLLATYGLFANMMPVAVDADPDMGVIDFINRVSDDWHSTLLMNNHSLTKFCDEINCLPTIFFSYHGSMVDKSCTVEGQEVPTRQLVDGYGDDDLQCIIFNDGDQHEIHLEANDAIYNEAYIHRFAEPLKASVRTLMEHSDGRLKDIEILL